MLIIAKRRKTKHDFEKHKFSVYKEWIRSKVDYKAEYAGRKLKPYVTEEYSVSHNKTICQYLEKKNQFGFD